ncbi:hypothetical protein ACLMJK_001983 [Lecanora helva]
MFIVLVILFVSIVNSTNALNLPSYPTLSMALRDSCSDTKQVSSHGKYPLGPPTRIYNDTVLFQILQGGQRVDPSHRNDALDILRYIRTEINGEGSPDDVIGGDYGYSWIVTLWTSPTRMQHSIKRNQAANVITNICLKVRNHGPEEIHLGRVTDEAGNQLTEFRMFFNLEN